MLEATKDDVAAIVRNRTFFTASKEFILVDGDTKGIRSRRSLDVLRGLVRVLRCLEGGMSFMPPSCPCPSRPRPRPSHFVTIRPFEMILRHYRSPARPQRRLRIGMKGSIFGIGRDGDKCGRKTPHRLVFFGIQTALGVQRACRRHAEGMETACS